MLFAHVVNSDSPLLRAEGGALYMESLLIAVVQHFIPNILCSWRNRFRFRDKACLPL